MNGILWALLGTGLGLLVPLMYRLWQRHQRESADLPPTAVAPARRPLRPSTPVSAGPVGGGLKRRLARQFHGISVKCGPHPCQAIGALRGQRFLPEEAPTLPLAGCDQDKCQCAYSHHRDRRDAEDRRAGWGTFGGFIPTVPGGNRRKKSPDRRTRAS